MTQAQAPNTAASPPPPAARPAAPRTLAPTAYSGHLTAQAFLPSQPQVKRRRTIATYGETFDAQAAAAISGGKGVNHNASRVNWPCVPLGYGYLADNFQSHLGLKMARLSLAGKKMEFAPIPTACQGVLTTGDQSAPCGNWQAQMWCVMCGVDVC